MARSHFLLFLLLASLGALLVRVSYAHKDHVVGGGFGWKIPPNPSFYQEWAATNTFVVGDKLVFMYRTSVENVLEVSAEDYGACGNNKVIDIYYKGPTIVELNTPGPHFFYSGIGLHCEAAQKLAVNVAITAPPPPFVADESLYSVGSLKIFAAPALSPVSSKQAASTADSCRYITPAVAVALFGGYLLHALGM